jgi:hypothetical protein
MAREPLKNVGASVRARLLQRSREERTDFQILLWPYLSRDPDPARRRRRRGLRCRWTRSRGARIPIQVDVGFGDAITPGPIEIDYPALLDAPAPHLRAYPIETVVAEKFQPLPSAASPTAG